MLKSYQQEWQQNQHKAQSVNYSDLRFRGSPLTPHQRRRPKSSISSKPLFLHTAFLGDCVVTSSSERQKRAWSHTSGGLELCRKWTPTSAEARNRSKFQPESRWGGKWDWEISNIEYLPPPTPTPPCHPSPNISTREHVVFSLPQSSQEPFFRFGWP